MVAPSPIAAPAAAFIAEWEDIRLEVYKDPGGIDTLGIGHRITESEHQLGLILIGGEQVQWRNGITREQAIALLAQDVSWAIRCVERLVKVPLNPNQEVALVSFVYNVGCGTFKGSPLLRLLNAGNYGAVPDRLRKYVYDDGVILPGLVRRREAEAELWQKPAS